MGGYNMKIYVMNNDHKYSPKDNKDIILEMLRIY